MCFINNPYLKEIYIYIFFNLGEGGEKKEKKWEDWVGDGARVSNFY